MERVWEWGGRRWKVKVSGGGGEIGCKLGRGRRGKRKGAVFGLCAK